MTEREIAFAKGDYEFEFDGAHVTVHVPYDVYVDEIRACATILAGARAETEGDEKDAA